ncbi:unnamed protein product [Caenorhabditis brenneri]
MKQTYPNTRPHGFHYSGETIFELCCRRKEHLEKIIFAYDNIHRLEPHFSKYAEKALTAFEPLVLWNFENEYLLRSKEIDVLMGKDITLNTYYGPGRNSSSFVGSNFGNIDGYNQQSIPAQTKQLAIMGPPPENGTPAPISNTNIQTPMAQYPIPQQNMSPAVPPNGQNLNSTSVGYQTQVQYTNIMPQRSMVPYLPPMTMAPMQMPVSQMDCPPQMVQQQSTYQDPSMYPSVSAVASGYAQYPNYDPGQGTIANRSYNYQNGTSYPVQQAPISNSQMYSYDPNIVYDANGMPYQRVMVNATCLVPASDNAPGSTYSSRQSSSDTVTPPTNNQEMTYNQSYPQRVEERPTEKRRYKQSSTRSDRPSRKTASQKTESGSSHNSAAESNSATMEQTSEPIVTTKADQKNVNEKVEAKDVDSDNLPPSCNLSSSQTTSVVVNEVELEEHTKHPTVVSSKTAENHYDSAANDAQSSSAVDDAQSLSAAHDAQSPSAADDAQSSSASDDAQSSSAADDVQSTIEADFVQSSPIPEEKPTVEDDIVPENESSMVQMSSLDDEKCNDASTSKTCEIIDVSDSGLASSSTIGTAVEEEFSQETSSSMQTNAPEKKKRLTKKQQRTIAAEKQKLKETDEYVLQQAAKDKQDDLAKMKAAGIEPVMLKVKPSAPVAVKKQKKSKPPKMIVEKMSVSTPPVQSIPLHLEQAIVCAIQNRALKIQNNGRPLTHDCPFRHEFLQKVADFEKNFIHNEEEEKIIRQFLFHRIHVFKNILAHVPHSTSRFIIYTFIMNNTPSVLIPELGFLASVIETPDFVRFEEAFFNLF